MSVIEIVDHQFLIDRWIEIETLIRHEFQNSEFNDGFTVERPLWHIQEGIKGNLGQGIKHVLALNENNKILAAAFCIPSLRESNDNSCDIGWFFASSDFSGIEKIRFLDQIFIEVHKTIKAAGFGSIITNMGTQEGAKYLGKRQGYRYEPTSEKLNRWVKEL